VTREAGPYAEVARALAGTAFASISYVEETESTNADAAARLDDERFGGHTIVAEYQRRGAGRKGRPWQAAAGMALLFTTILPLAVGTEKLWAVPFWVALAVRAGLRRCGVMTTLQWPNDLLLDERKVAGVLSQSSVTGTTAHVACGVGINVHRWRDAATSITPPPAFCDEVAAIDRGALLQAILVEYERSLSMLDEPERIIRAWDEGAGLPGRRYRIQPDHDAQPFEGIAQGLASGGGLRIVRDDGKRETIALADARVLRKA
jgi:BirA family biotin operon repressor/biotin-[acetyl-CoA-carboxylase] ligase